MTRNADFIIPRRREPSPTYLCGDVAVLGHRTAALESRDDFGTFREYFDPAFMWNWWTDELADYLQAFYEDMVAGKRPKLAIMAPPQHGKSRAIQDFVIWCLGNNPDLNVIYGSYSNELGERTNAYCRRAFSDHERYHNVFPHIRIGVPGYKTTHTHIEIPGFRGSFRNVTVEGGVTGFGLNLGIVDDPVKGRSEANSKLVRDKTWMWFTDEFYIRCAADSGLLLIMTRWHVDDLLGRALELFPDLKVLRYPAVAAYTLDRESRRRIRNWQDERQEGEALFPCGNVWDQARQAYRFEMWKPLDLLAERKKVLTDASWESLYQQRPFISGGGVIPIEKLTTIPNFGRDMVRKSIRYWDKGGSTGEDSPYTAGVLMHQLKDGRYLIEHIERGRWPIVERNAKIRMLADLDSRNYSTLEIWIEQEPGSGGKESAERTIQQLAGYRVFADKVGKAAGNKEVRAEPLVAQIQGGNVYLNAGPWNYAFVEECEPWPHSKYKDQVDAAAGAFNKLTDPMGNYNTNWAEWAL